MDERVRKLTTPEQCEIFARNANDRNRPDLAREARARAVELHAESHGAQNVDVSAAFEGSSLKVTFHLMACHNGKWREFDRWMWNQGPVIADQSTPTPSCRIREWPL